MQVSALGTAVVDPADGSIETGDLGDMICRYAYDGLGRLIHKKTPINVGATKLQTKDFYYDGVRRVQEHITRPLELFNDLRDGGQLLLGGAENDELAAAASDGSDPLQQILGDGIDGISLDQEWLDRE